MSPVVKNILFFILAAVIGSLINGGLVNLGHSVIPGPEGFDLKIPDEFIRAVPHFEPMHWLFPFLAHAIGTVVGAFIVAKFAASSWKKLALGIGLFFFLGGVAASFLIKPPIWMIVVDLLLAYFPMGYLGWKLAGAK